MTRARPLGSPAAEIEEGWWNDNVVPRDSRSRGSLSRHIDSRLRDCMLVTTRNTLYVHIAKGDIQGHAGGSLMHAFMW